MGGWHTSILKEHEISLQNVHNHCGRVKRERVMFLKNETKQPTNQEKQNITTL